VLDGEQASTAQKQVKADRLDRVGNDERDTAYDRNGLIRDLVEGASPQFLETPLSHLNAASSDKG
jgi:hypothetical protein